MSGFANGHVKRMDIPIKSDSEIRICGDYRITLNQNIENAVHPPPRFEAILHKLAKGRWFTKLDLSQACLKLDLDEPTKRVVYPKHTFRSFPSEAIAVWNQLCAKYIPIAIGEYFQEC